MMLLYALFIRRGTDGAAEPNRHAVAALEYGLAAAVVITAATLGFFELADGLAETLVRLSGEL